MDLQQFFKENPRVAIAFSGGVDSSYLLYAALRYGARVRAYYVNSAFQPRFELEDARRLAGDLHAVVQAHAGTGQKIHDLAAVGVGMKADGGAGLQRQPQDLAHTVLKDAGLGLSLAALEPGLHQRGHTVKVQRHDRSLSSGSP